MMTFIDHADILLKQIWNDSNVQIVQKVNHLGKDKFCLIDISLNLSNKDQDKLYLDSYFYRTNIRKGNTLIETFNLKSKGKSQINWGRKGTQKIFDIKLQYLLSITQTTYLTNKQDKKSFDVIFRSKSFFDSFLDVIKYFENGKRVQLLKTQKPIGQNAQISYFYELDAWIICSKNVSLLARNLKDLQIYEEKRYAQVKQIAIQWFQEIKHLSKQKIKKLKGILDGYTLIGIYCGNPIYQQLTQYNQIKIIWFALIDNFSDQYCLDPYEVKKKIQDFGFKFIKIKRSGSFDDKKQFFKALQQLYLKTAEAGIQDTSYGVSGSIVYFVSPDMKGNQIHSKVLGLAKLKTLQYHFFISIKQKLSSFLSRKLNQEQIIIKYQQECLELQKHNRRRAPYPLSYYKQILKAGCELIKHNNIQLNFLRSKFVSILKLLFYVITKNISLNQYGKQLIKNQNLLNQLYEIPLQKFGALNCNQKIIFIPISLPLISKSYLSKKIQENFNKLDLSYNIIESKNPNQIENRLSEQIFKQINQNNTLNQQPFLMHFYIDHSLECQEIFQLQNLIKLKGNKNIYHKIVFITDNYTDQQHFEQNYNSYPFRLETIIFSYYSIYKKYYNTPTIQQKITQLQKVTKQIKKRRNFQENSSILKSNSNYPISFAKNVQIQQNDEQEIKNIASDIVSGNKQYQNYCRLILKLQKLHKNSNNLQHLTEKQLNEQVQNLIKSSFPSNPVLSNL